MNEKNKTLMIKRKKTEVDYKQRTSRVYDERKNHRWITTNERKTDIDYERKESVVDKRKKKGHLT